MFDDLKVDGNFQYSEHLNMFKTRISRNSIVSWNTRSIDARNVHTLPNPCSKNLKEFLNKWICSSKEPSQKLAMPLTPFNGGLEKQLPAKENRAIIKVVLENDSLDSTSPVLEGTSTLFPEFMADLKEKRIKILPGENISEAYFFALIGEERHSEDLVDKWLVENILEKLSQIYDKKQLDILQKELKFLPSKMGTDNAFLLLCRGYQMVVTLKEERSSFSILSNQFDQCEQLFALLLRQLVSQNPLYLALNLEEIKFNKKMVNFIEQLQEKKKQDAQWTYLIKVVRYTFALSAILAIATKLFRLTAHDTPTFDHKEIGPKALQFIQKP